MKNGLHQCKLSQKWVKKEPEPVLRVASLTRTSSNDNGNWVTTSGVTAIFRPLPTNHVRRTRQQQRKGNRVGATPCKHDSNSWAFPHKKNRRPCLPELNVMFRAVNWDPYDCSGGNFDNFIHKEFIGRIPYCITLTTHFTRFSIYSTCMNHDLQMSASRLGAQHIRTLH